MSKSSIHIATGGGINIMHNSRETFSLSQVFSDEKNEVSCNSKVAFEIYRQELSIRSQAYTKRTHQKLQKRAITHLSAIVNLNENHTLKDLDPLKKFLEQKLDTKVFQIAIHKDEGKLTEIETGLDLVSGKDFFKNPKDNKLYFDRKYTKKIDMSQYDIQKNYHAHIEFMGLDSEGNSIKRNRLNRNFLRELQTFTANSLQMQRGVTNKSYTKEQILEITKHLKPKEQYPSPKAYGIAFNKVARELGYYFPKKKRLDTHEFKAKAKFENDVKREQYENTRELKLTVTALKKEISNLRNEMKDKNKELEEKNEQKVYTQADYVALNKLKKELKKDNLSEIYQAFLRLQRELDKKSEQLQKLANQKKEVLNALTPTFYKLQKAGKNPPQNYVKFIKFVDEEMKTYEKELIETKKELSEQNRELLEVKQENYTLEAKKSSKKRNMDEIEQEIKTELDDNELTAHTGFSFFRKLKEKIISLKAYIQELFQENIDLKSDNEILKKENQELRKEKYLQEYNKSNSNSYSLSR